ncbi:transglycosylase domain-containing protein [Leifsonia sp. H3M29-4]|uniref:transglycosylase domain-containing protein n=1 Tax=Salinibacterium metalliresistens TaxID=3031321 RepID=UPI0023DB6D55|nr:transglycosylase domain-containing protein [Salinibacterium metalliresistens]MDF1479067.1 transglycosylase domain-containing protein [Salinibacterium metalliresistens]
MSAQKAPRRGFFSAILGLLGFSALAGLLVTVMVAPAIAVTGVTASSAIGVFDSLPEYLEIGDLPQRNEIYANSAAGPVQIATVYDQNREEVPYDQISQYALDAAVDGEDRRFFDHGGVDMPGLIRAALGNIGAGGIESGASTLSMQVVKNTFIQDALNEETPEKVEAAYEKAVATSFDRKLKEMKLAIGLEKKYTKKEILVAYLNISNFGNATYGIQAAAQRYFSVDAKDLTLAQAASLIAIVQYPNQRNLADPENYGENQIRRDYILGAMLDAGSVTQAEYDEAIAIPVDENFVKLQAPTNGCIAANDHAKWFCDYVVKSVKDFAFLGATEQERKDAWKAGGYKLYTTLDMDVQVTAQDQVWTYAPPSETTFALGSAISAVQPGTGRVLVMAENKIFDDSLEPPGPEYSAVNYNTSYNYGGSNGIQPGSTYKLFTFLAWMEAGKGVNERLVADPGRMEQSSFKVCGDAAGGPPFTFRNASNEKGIYTIRDGTVQSINGIYFRMAQQLDLCDIRDVAVRLGVERADGGELETNVSSIIGTNYVTPLSMAGAYATVAALGKYCKPIIVDTVIKPTGEEITGQTPECKNVLSPEVAATAVDVLKQVLNVSATANANPRDGVPIFGKTGTTDSNNQTWMASATTNIAMAVWVGNSIGDYDMFDASYNGVRGQLLRHIITRNVIGTANAKYGGGDWPAPAANLLTGSGAEIPNVVGLTPEAAKALLESLGFSFADGGQVDSDADAGKIVQTDPAAGTQSAKGALVTVYTSKANMKAFPDVVGDGTQFTFGQAQSTLGSQYPSVSQTCVVLEPLNGDPAVLPGDPRIDKVQASNPAPGTKVIPGVAVTLSIGKITCSP